jgi:glycine hydroxymethyltransferase
MRKSQIQKLIDEHGKIRSEGLNLIASENYLSSQVKNALASDLAGRYHSKWYGGSEIAQKIIGKTEELAKRLFKAKYAIVTPLSGNICDLAVIFAFTSPDEKVAMVPFSAGGYPLGVDKFNRKRLDIPMNNNTFDIDVKKTQKLIEDKKIKLTILGSSFLLFPHPVKQISSFTKKVNFPCNCVYDGSHVLGLIATGQFQNPLKEGAKVLFGSTHKTFYGPQGGIVLTNSKKHADSLKSYLELVFETGIGLVDNPHMNRIAALGIAMEEILEDQDYGKRVIENAQILAETLDELGLPVRFKNRGYTQSHQILLDIEQKPAEELCHKLEEIGILIDNAARIGVAEVTHRGIGTENMIKIAELISQVYFWGSSSKLKKYVKELISSVDK